MIDYEQPFSWLDKHPRHLCTCCPVPRLAVHRWDGGESWHIDNGHFASFSHVHVESHTTDCDGPFTSSRTQQPMRTDDPIHDNGNGMEDGYALFRRIVGYSISLHAEYGGTLTVHPAERIGERHAEWTERTDEGGRYVDVQLCTRASCARESSSQRDYFAEAMGY